MPECRKKVFNELGYERPDETHKEGRFNNVKQTFDAVCWEKLFEFAKNHGVELISKPLPKKDVGLSIDEYIEQGNKRAKHGNRNNSPYVSKRRTLNRL
ncbi:MAG: hypothetical protein K2N06_03495 [Oscillospiraceae bacterium]|nr:hypothetical protein [Oscillospiraceae bacterium]